MSAPQRLRSLDVFRGLTVAAMILVNSPGRDEVYAAVRHADWNGVGGADFVFPAFLVILGASAALSFAARRARGQGAVELAAAAAKRAAGLFAFGLIVNAIIRLEGGAMRWPGTLQRIALCALGVSAVLLLPRARVLSAFAAALLLLYWGLLSLAPLTPELNVAYRLDRLLMEGHLLDRWGDPEGLLSTLGALGTAFIGAAAGRRLAARGAKGTPELGAAGIALASLGVAWSFWLPLNKHLWTPSYALVGAGTALAAFAACAALVEGRTARWARAFEPLGRHALAAYVLGGLAYDLQEFFDVKLKITAALFEPRLAPRAASLAYALAYTAAAAAIASFVAKRLDRRQQ